MLSKRDYCAIKTSKYDNIHILYGHYVRLCKSHTYQQDNKYLDEIANYELSNMTLTCSTLEIHTKAIG